jgi:ethanolamine ammonia-lyase large subunit
MKILGKNKEGYYFADYSTEELLIGKEFEYKDTKILIIGIYDQFMSTLESVPIGWKTILKLKTSHSDFNDLNQTTGWILTDKNIEL